MTAPTAKWTLRELMRSKSTSSSKVSRNGAGVVIAGRGFGAGGAEPRIDVVRLEEAGLAQRGRHERTREVTGLAVDVAIRRVVPDLAAVMRSQKICSLSRRRSRRIAGNDRRIDRADRHPAHPIRLDACFVQRLIDTGLIGAERAAALQHQRDPVAAIGPPVRARCEVELNVACARPWQYLVRNEIKRSRRRIQGSGDIGMTMLAAALTRIRRCHTSEENISHRCRRRPLAIAHCGGRGICNRAVLVAGISFSSEESLPCCPENRHRDRFDQRDRSRHCARPRRQRRERHAERVRRPAGDRGHPRATSPTVTTSR